MADTGHAYRFDHAFGPGLAYFGRVQARPSAPFSSLFLRPFRMTPYRPILIVVLLVVFLGTPSLHAQSVPLWDYVDSLPNSPVGRYDDMAWVDPERGWVVNLAGEIWHTDDGAATWTRQALRSDVRFRSVACRDYPSTATGKEVCWAGTVTSTDAGNSAGMLWETRDGGAHWIDITHRISGTVPYGICGMVSIGSKAWAVGAYYGEPTIIRSENGGETWVGTPVGNLAENLIDVYFKNELEGYATGGTDGLATGTAVVLRTLDGGLSWERVHVSSLTAGAQAEWGWKISFPTDDTGYISVEYASSNAPTAKVLKTTDGGATWSEVYIEGSNSSAGLQGIGFISATTGWASGRGVTSVTTDGGTTWTQLGHYNPGTNNGQLDGAMNRFFVVNDTLAYGVGLRLYELTTASSTSTALEAKPLPDAFSLADPYPNPFVEEARLPYSLERASMVHVQVIDMLGRIHRSFPSRYLQPGSHEIIWDGTDEAGTRVPSGGYIFLVDIGDSIETKRVVFVK